MSYQYATDHIDGQCQCYPCTLPRARGGRCPSTDTFIGGVQSSHCLACAFCCFDDEEMSSR